MGVPSHPISPIREAAFPVDRKASHCQPANLKCETNNNNNVGNCNIIVIIARINILHFSQIVHCNVSAAACAEFSQFTDSDFETLYLRHLPTRK